MLYPAELLPTTTNAQWVDLAANSAKAVQHLDSHIDIVDTSSVKATFASPL
jgi:hypothetical protein